MPPIVSRGSSKKKTFKRVSEQKVVSDTITPEASWSSSYSNSNRNSSTQNTSNNNYQLEKFDYHNIMNKFTIEEGPDLVAPNSTCMTGGFVGINDNSLVVSD